MDVNLNGYPVPPPLHSRKVTVAYETPVTCQGLTNCPLPAPSRQQKGFTDHFVVGWLRLVERIKAGLQTPFAVGTQ